MIEKLLEILKKRKYTILSFVLAFVCGCCIFLIRDYISSHKFMFFSYDLQNQMLPVLNMFYRNILHGKSLLYSFEIGLGSGSIPYYTNGSCFSIINILLLLPVDLNAKLLFLFLVKMSLSAFFFCLMIEYISNKKSYVTVLFSLAYSFCSFNIVYYHVIIWQDGMYILPIIILCIYKYFRDKKVSLLILAYAYLFICNFYSGYIIGIYSFVLFLILLVLNNKSIKEKVRMLVKYIISVLISVMVSSIFLIPTAATIVTNDNSESTIFSDIAINCFDLIKQLYLGQYYADEATGVVPYVYCGLFPLICFVFFFFNPKVKKNNKIIIGILMSLLLFSLLLKPGYILMHAFNNPDNLGNRFAFLLPFTMLFACSIEYDVLIQMKKKNVVGIALVLIAYIVLYQFVFEKISKISISSNTIILLLNIIFILIYMFVVIYVSKNENSIKSILSILFFIEIIINALTLNNTMYRSETEYKEVYNSRFDLTKSEIDKLGNDYTRVIVENPITHNLSQNIGYRSVALFSSFANTNYRRFMRHIGFLSDDLGVDARGKTDITEMLLGVDYVVDVKLQNNIPISFSTEQKKSLPLCYMSDSSIIDVNMSDNPFTNINLILSSLTGENIEYFYNTGNNIKMYYNNVVDNVGDYNGREVVFFGLKDSSENYGDIHFIDETGMSKYCYIGIKENYEYYDSPIIWGDNVEYRNTNFPSFMSSAHIVKMNETEDDTECYIIIDEESLNAYYYDMAYFYGANESVLDEVYNKLLCNSMVFDVFEDGYIAGTVISHDENKILFTTIPYEENWNVYIDGNKVKSISLIDGALLGVEIPEGKHFVELKYKDRWFIVGIYISFCGILLLIFALICDNKNSNFFCNKIKLDKKME